MPRLCIASLALCAVALAASAQGTYLIIADEAYAASGAVDSLAALRRQDYSVKRVTAQDAVDSSGSVKQYLRNHQYDPGHDHFVVLIGDKSLFPWDSGAGIIDSTTVLYNHPPTYRYYVPADSSLFQLTNVHLGLMFVDNQAQLSNIIRKTIVMANGYTSLPLKATLFGTYHSDGTINFSYNNVVDTLWEPAGWDTEKIYVYSDGKTGEDVINALNDGTRILCAAGHGAPEGWVEWHLHKEDSLTVQLDNDIQPFVWTFCCNNGNFTVDTCWALYWMWKEKYGSSFVGASSKSTNDQFLLNEGMVKAMVVESLTTLGPILEAAKRHVYLSDAAYAPLYLAEEYHLFGDPALEVWSVDEMSVARAGSGGNRSPFPAVSLRGGELRISMPSQQRFTIELFSPGGRLLLRQRNALLTKGPNALRLARPPAASSVVWRLSAGTVTFTGTAAQCR